MTNTKISRLGAFRRRLIEAGAEMQWHRIADFIKLRDLPETKWGGDLRQDYPRTPEYLLLRARLMRLARR